MHISMNFRSVIQAAEIYFSQRATFLCQFLPPMRSYYQLIFYEKYDDWRKFCASHTKHGVYKEVNNLRSGIVYVFFMCIINGYNMK